MINPITPKNETSNTQIKTEGTPILTRAEVLAKLAECINMVHAKIKKGRIRETDKQKETMLKTQGYLTGIYLQGLKDMEMQDITERIVRLEQEREKVKE
jgi:hypothetical protein